LITGGAGYIGSVVTSTLLEGGYEVATVDDFSNSSASGLDGRVENHNFSIHDKVKLCKVLKRCDAVIHLAASSIVSESVQYPEKYAYNNVEGTKSLLEAMWNMDVSKILFSSSCSVYASDSSKLINEETVCKPTSPYAQSKLDSDLLIEEFALNRKLEATVFRFFNVSGAYLNDESNWRGERHAIETHLIPSILLADKKGMPIYVYGDDWDTEDGSCVRDYIHVADIAKAFKLSLAANQNDHYEVYNLGSGIGHSVFEIIKGIEKVLDRSIEYEVKSKRQGDSASLVADPSKAFRKLTWKPVKSLINIIEDNVSFLNSST